MLLTCYFPVPAVTFVVDDVKYITLTLTVAAVTVVFVTLLLLLSC